MTGKLLKCIDCGHDVSTRAKFCPNCGRPSPAPRTSTAVRWLIGGLVALAFIGYVLEPSSPPSQSHSSTQQRVAGPSLPSREERRQQFPNKRQELIAEGRSLLEEGKYAEAVRFLYQWVFIADNELTSIYYRAREQQLVSQLKGIPVANFGANEARYEELVRIRPDNEHYQRKLNFYRDKIGDGDRQFGSKQPVARTIRSGNIGHTMLLEMTQAGRNETLGAVVEESGEACGAGEGTYFQGTDDDRVAYWNVLCSNGSSFGVQIQPDADATAKVIDCKLLEFVSGVACFTRFD